MTLGSIHALGDVQQDSSFASVIVHFKARSDGLHIRSKIENSVTRRADCFFNIWPFTMMKFCPKAYKIGEILPNLVTLIENSLTGHILFIRYIGQNPSAFITTNYARLNESYYTTGRPLPGAYSIKFYGSVNYGFVVTAKF